MKSSFQPIVDVDEATFEREVLERSRAVPVMVDFWASWCGPCRMLSPVLEQLARDDYPGKVVLAKIDTDQNPELAARFGIRGIPAVKFFVNGEVVEEFTGYLPDDQIRPMIDALAPSRADELVAEADAIAVGGGSELAREARLREALELEPGHPGATLALGQLLESNGAHDDAQDLYRDMRGGSDAQIAQVQQRMTRLQLLEAVDDLPSEEELQRRLEDDADDHEARHGLALHHVRSEDYRAALEHLLELVGRDRSYGDDAGRRTMLDVFELIGLRSPLADEFRDKLSKVLF